MTAIAPRPVTTALTQMFSPRSIAVVGASTSPGKLGAVMTDAITAAGAGTMDVYPINPRVTAPGFYATVAEATAANGGPLDLAVFCIPASHTPAAVQEAADMGVGAAVICSGGFAEVGADGEAAQQKIAETCALSGIRVLGPNTSGFFAPGKGVRVSFVPTVAAIAPGGVAVVAASGGMNHALSLMLSERGVGVGLGVGLGNSVDVTNADVLDHLCNDDSISAIALHVESVSDGRALLDAVRRVTERKPLIALTVGRADVSAFSASHTGALATSWRVTRALLAEAGAVVVDNEYELVDSLAVLSQVRLAAMAAPGVGLVTAQAGPGLMVLDDLLSHGIAVPPLSEKTTISLSQLLPPMTFQSNPVDTGRPGRSFGGVLAATADDPGVDVLAVYALAEPDAIDLGESVASSRVSEGTPTVLGVGGPRDSVAATSDSAARLSVPVLPGPTALATGVRALVRDSRARFFAVGGRHATESRRHHGPVSFPVDEHDAKTLLAELGIPTPDRRACTNRAAAHDAFDELSGPLAVKILDAAVLHKTDVGGVHLGVRTVADLDRALDGLDRINAKAYLLESMAEPGVDLVLGVRRDPVFGPIIVAGLGGTAAEAIADVAIRSHQVSHLAASRMLDELQCAALLHGWRGGPTLNRDEFATVVTSLARFAEEHPEVSDLEINPLRLTSTGLIALDAVVIASDNGPAAAGGTK